MKRTTIWLGSADKEAIEIIKVKYGMKSDSAVIRFALRIIASSKVGISNNEN